VLTLLTCESVTEGHPDKVADFIADSILDAHLEGDADSRVACEVLCKGGHVLLAGEISSGTEVDYETTVRDAVRRIGYVHSEEPFSADRITVTSWLTAQSVEIGRAVSAMEGDRAEQGAGEQGMMYGYACDETPSLLPLPLVLAHGLSRQLAEDRRSGNVPWLRPDGKTQVTVRYESAVPVELTHVVVSTQHTPDTSQPTIEAYVRDSLAPRVLREWLGSRTGFAINPSGSFVQGGPSVDCGLTGRKIIVDTYGGIARHGGGSFSGKDPSKVDRSGAYFCRYVARQVVAAGMARRVEVAVAYAIGVAQPVSVDVDTMGTGDDEAVRAFIRERFDFRPGAIVERLELLRPIYAATTNYGHFGREGLPWEA
jgi:S-adenosylmethionine synthetase